MLRPIEEVMIGRQQHKLMADAQLHEESVDCPDLHALSSTTIPDLGSSDVIVPAGDDQGKRGEALNDTLPGLGTCKTLEELLEHQTCGVDRFLLGYRLFKTDNRWLCRRTVTPERQRPNTGVNEKAQDRERSFL
jgi:hypothetical protein